MWLSTVNIQNERHSKQRAIEPLSVAQNTFFNAIGCLCYLGCQWVTTVMVVRLSSSYGNSGLYAFAMATGIIFASIALYKVRTFQVSDISNQFSNSSYIAFRLITILIGWIVCAVYIPIATNRQMSLITVSLLYLVFKTDESFSDVLYGIYQKNGRMDYIGISQFIRGFLSLCTFSVGLALTDSLSTAIVSMTVSCMLVTIVYDLPHARRFGSIKPIFDNSSLLSLAKICFFAMLASLLANSIVSSVRQYFGIVNGSEALGHYASVATPAVLIQVAATYLYSPLIGKLAADLKKDRVLFLKSFIKTMGMLILVMGICVLALSLVGSKLLTVAFGDSIQPYTYLFPYVLIATAAVGLLLYCNDVLIIQRRMRQTLICNGVAFTCAIVSAIPLIAISDMNGINYSIILGCSIAILSSLFCIIRR